MSAGTVETLTAGENNGIRKERDEDQEVSEKLIICSPQMVRAGHKPSWGRGEWEQRKARLWLGSSVGLHDKCGIDDRSRKNKYNPELPRKSS